MHNFFNLSSFTHHKIFQSVCYPWEALQNMPSYLVSLKFELKSQYISSSAFLINPEKIYIGEGTVVEAGAYICGPCWIGNNCRIRHGAYIRGGSIIDSDAVVGHATEVKNSIFLNGAKAAHFAYVGDSILGAGVNLGAGVKCANVRLDQQVVYIKLSGKKINTGQKKLGSIIGDFSQIGCNSVLNPGTCVERKFICHPLSNIGGYHATITNN